jgi:uncharacterized lipoprotein YbaY
MSKATRSDWRTLTYATLKGHLLNAAERSVPIKGIVRLAAPDVFEDATVIIGLDDVSLIDAPSRRIAERTIEHVRGPRAEIPFRLEVPSGLSRSSDYVLSAEIHRSGEALAAGDYLSVAACPWRPGETEDQVIPVRKI